MRLIRVFTVQPPAAAGDRADRPAADVQPFGDLAVRKLALFEQAIDLVD
jgi:hypothetical protein